jgi:FkbM family methyltransferase
VPEHHPIFQDFIPRDFIHDSFLGTVSRREFTSEAIAQTVTACGPTGLPAFNEEYFEWLDLLESIQAWKPGSGPYTFMELGAGYGRWSVRAVFARRLTRIIAVEAEPTHYEWMKQNFADNGLKSDRHKLIQAAVSDMPGGCIFMTGRPSEWYGQRILQPGESVEFGSIVNTVTLSELLEREFVDLLDMDIQGHELAVLRAGLEALNQKVKRIHIATHGAEIERELRNLLAPKWKAIWDFGCGEIRYTPYGAIEFQDGVQSWVNSRFL